MDARTGERHRVGRAQQPLGLRRGRQQPDARQQRQDAVAQRTGHPARPAGRTAPAAARRRRRTQPPEQLAVRLGRLRPRPPRPPRRAPRAAGPGRAGGRRPAARASRAARRWASARAPCAGPRCRARAARPRSATTPGGRAPRWDGRPAPTGRGHRCARNVSHRSSASASRRGSSCGSSTTTSRSAGSASSSESSSASEQPAGEVERAAVTQRQQHHRVVARGRRALRGERQPQRRHVVVPTPQLLRQPGVGAGEIAHLGEGLRAREPDAVAVREHGRVVGEGEDGAEPDPEAAGGAAVALGRGPQRRQREHALGVERAPVFAATSAGSSPSTSRSSSRPGTPARTAASAAFCASSTRTRSR